ncbi:hypothetical protein, conserved [Eimeria brunetti]|uniref:Uncharacterized protein n=1 Tax=Eimeria brunetti TaxID=51314 RepID=U6LV20_9EIME|nr:hypothetical protein, conserved [Eimeria brunetti]
MGQWPEHGGGPGAPHGLLPGFGSLLGPKVDDAVAEESESEDASSTTVPPKKKLPVSPVMLRASAALLLPILLLSGLAVHARRERRPVGAPVPTDREGLKGTLDSLEKAAESVRAKWNDLSEPVHEAFHSFYSPGGLQRVLDVPQNVPDAVGFLVDTYAKALKARPLPGEDASEEEKVDYALCNMVLEGTLRAVEIRLDQLAKLEKFAEEHPDTPVFHLGTSAAPLWMNKAEREEPTVSFAEFFRRIEAEGNNKAAPSKDSGPKVPEVLVERLTNLISVQKLIETSDRAVLETFKGVLGFVAQAKFGRDTSGKKRVDNFVIPPLDVPFPFARLADVVDRTAARAKLRSFSPSKMRLWEKQWHVPGLQGVISNLKGAIEGNSSFQKKERVAALSGWAQDKDVLSRLMHPFTIAISLL